MLSTAIPAPPTPPPAPRTTPPTPRAAVPSQVISGFVTCGGLDVTSGKMTGTSGRLADAGGAMEGRVGCLLCARGDRGLPLYANVVSLWCPFADQGLLIEHIG